MDNQDIAQMPYEVARGELLQVVRNLESGQSPLEETLTLWERGEALAGHCQAILDQATQRMNAKQQAAPPQG